MRPFDPGNKALWSTLALLLVLGLSPLNAQNNPNVELDIASLDVIISLTEDRIDSILQGFDPYLTEAQKKMLKQIKINVTYGEEILDVKAENNPGTGQRTITISTGFILTMMRIEHASAIAVVLNRNDATYPFLVEIIKDLVDDDSRRTAGKPRTAPIVFENFVKLSAKESELLKDQKERVSEMFALASYTSLAFTIAHELSHHFLRQTKLSDHELFKQEMDADAFAIQLLIKSGIDPFLGIAPLTFYLTVLDMAKRGYADLSQVAERLLVAVEKGIQMALSDRRFMENLKKQGLDQNFKKYVELISLYRQHLNQCKPLWNEPLKRKEVQNTGVDH